MNPSLHHKYFRSVATARLALYTPWALAFILFVLLVVSQTPETRIDADGNSRPGGGRFGISAAPKRSTFVTYSYFEKDDIQKTNFDFFILAAMGVGTTKGQDPESDFFIILNGDTCTPCAALYPLLRDVAVAVPGVAWVRQGPGITLLKRTENEGMDFAAHNTSMTYSMQQGNFWHYKYYLFLNSSIKGPFIPKYVPGIYHWSMPFTSMLNSKVKAVSSSLVCLPQVDAGGYGPKLESWAFATDPTGLRVILDRGVFHTRTCKLCKDGIVVMGEYGLTRALFDRGYTIDTLLAMYNGVDWHDSSNWNCNNNVHPSRHGTYSGMSMHPYETVFVKSSWHVGIPFTDKYSDWLSKQLVGLSTTQGNFDAEMYTYGVQLYAQDKHPYLDRAYAVGPNVQRQGLAHFTTG